MATRDQMRQRIEQVARQLCAEFGEVDGGGEAVCWLDAVERRAVEIGDAVAVELMKQQSADRPVGDEARCPGCGQPGRYRGTRQRELITRRGPATIAEPEYDCPACRRAFFPADQSAGR